MRSIGSRLTRLVACVLVLALATGCRYWENAEEDADDDTVTWDLSEPPTREDVGMQDTQSVSVHRSTEPTLTQIELPDAVSVQVPLVRIEFTNMGAVPARGSDPTSLEARTDRMTLADLEPQYRSTLDQLGMSTEHVDRFELEAGRATGAQDVTSRKISQTYGYLDLEVVAHFNPKKQRGYLTLDARWGTDDGAK